MSTLRQAVAFFALFSIVAASLTGVAHAGSAPPRSAVMTKASKVGGLGTMQSTMRQPMSRLRATATRSRTLSRMSRTQLEDRRARLEQRATRLQNFNTPRANAVFYGTAITSAITSTLGAGLILMGVAAGDLVMVSSMMILPVAFFGALADTVEAAITEVQLRRVNREIATR